ncbi:hypothetical protein BDY21DRAFT_152049 [Lineolata rhizophorae]|uniref:Uncharacterized protein n=1 Tax=Lineolata rhizophorae TaxID=578093 RepID=A0A6A6NMC6_9PEZI|nr:hypothetical protein BDY21DRAFT_152049 [Lineolata rhizophorae]
MTWLVRVKLEDGGADAYLCVPGSTLGKAIHQPWPFVYLRVPYADGEAKFRILQSPSVGSAKVWCNSNMPTPSVGGAYHRGERCSTSDEVDMFRGRLGNGHLDRRRGTAENLEAAAAQSDSSRSRARKDRPGCRKGLHSRPGRCAGPRQTVKESQGADGLWFERNGMPARGAQKEMSGTP